LVKYGGYRQALRISGHVTSKTTKALMGGTILVKGTTLGARSNPDSTYNKHLLFPIPQSEIDANQLAVQNPGY
jgi:hypothetical protein